MGMWTKAANGVWMDLLFRLDWWPLIDLCIKIAQALKKIATIILGVQYFYHVHHQL